MQDSYSNFLFGEKGILDTGRLGIVRRQEHSRRKLVFMLNDIMKSHGKVVNECLSREKFEIGVRYDKSFVFVRKAIVKQRVLQQCLRMKRECRTFTDNNLGVYGGKPLYTYSRDIDKFIADQHPRRRRVREAEKALKQSIRRGKILDPTTIPKKIEQYFDKNWNDDDEHIKIREIPSDVENNKDIFTKTKHALPPLRGINPYRKIRTNFGDDMKGGENEIQSPSTEKEKHNVSLEESKYQRKDMPLREVNKVAARQTSHDPTRKVLILPPIQQTKRMAQR